MTAPVSDAAAHYAVQVSADFRPRQRQHARRKTSRRYAAARRRPASTPPATAYRVIAGDFATSNAAQPLRDQLTQSGYGTNLLIVKRPTDQPFEKKHQLVDDEGERTTLDGESVLVMPVDRRHAHDRRQAVPHRRARLHQSARNLNVINELNMEDYLRGVVPAEMGPKIYDEVEALKAQAIAARTYAVRNLGQFKREGYDICAGPACQAYNGFSGEDPLTDRAVRETAGLVATYNGQPIDALYTATCGGETSDVGTMFPGRNEPYLKRVRCVEDEVLTHRRPRGQRPADRAAGQRAALRRDRRPARQRHVVERARRRAGRDRRDAEAAIHRRSPRASPASSRRGDVLTYLAAVLGFDRYSTRRHDARGSQLLLPADRGEGDGAVSRRRVPHQVRRSCPPKGSTAST